MSGAEVYRDKLSAMSGLISDSHHQSRITGEGEPEHVPPRPHSVAAEYLVTRIGLLFFLKTLPLIHLPSP